MITRCQQDRRNKLAIKPKNVKKMVRMDDKLARTLFRVANKMNISEPEVMRRALETYSKGRL